MGMRSIYPPSRAPWQRVLLGALRDGYTATEHGGLTTRLPIDLFDIQASWVPTRRVECLRSSLECMARTHGRFTRRHEPRPGDAPCGGCTATEAYQRVAPSILRVSKRRGAPTDV